MRRFTTIGGMLRDVFAYGSLQIPAVMQAVTGRNFASQPAMLQDYGRCRLRDRCYPGVRHRAGRRTEGVLYRRVDRLALSRLDRFEDPFYRRQSLRILVAPGCIGQAEVYVIPPANYRLLERRAWSLQRFRRYALKRYLRRCRRRTVAARVLFPWAGDDPVARKGG